MLRLNMSSDQCSDGRQRCLSNLDLCYSQTRWLLLRWAYISGQEVMISQHVRTRQEIKRLCGKATFQQKYIRSFNIYGGLFGCSEVCQNRQLQAAEETRQSQIHHLMHPARPRSSSPSQDILARTISWIWVHCLQISLQPSYIRIRINEDCVV